jgi:hypothetical protein
LSTAAGTNYITIIISGKLQKHGTLPLLALSSFLSHEQWATHSVPNFSLWLTRFFKHI